MRAPRLCRAHLGRLGATGRLRPGARRRGSPPLPHVPGAARRPALGQLLVRGPVPARLVQPRLLPAGSVAREPAARRSEPPSRRRSSSPRSRGASGATQALWPSRAFAIFAAAPLFTGLYSYSLGFAAMLGTVRALQADAPWSRCSWRRSRSGSARSRSCSSACCSSRSSSPRRRLTPSSAVLGGAVVVMAGFEVIRPAGFPDERLLPVSRRQPRRSPRRLAAGTLLARRARNGAFMVAFFGSGAAGSILASLVGTPVGDNWTRLERVRLPADAADGIPRRVPAPVDRRGRPRRRARLQPHADLLLIPYRLDSRPAGERFWQPALGFLRGHSKPGFRVEVVPTAAHWESYWIPRAGFALARGWYRQLDIVDNPVLYSNRLDPAAYRDWLRSAAVEYVLLPSTRARPGRRPARSDAAALRRDRPHGRLPGRRLDDLPAPAADAADHRSRNCTGPRIRPHHAQRGRLDPRAISAS